MVLRPSVGKLESLRLVKPGSGTSRNLNTSAVRRSIHVQVFYHHHLYGSRIDIEGAYLIVADTGPARLRCLIGHGGYATNFIDLTLTDVYYPLPALIKDNTSQ